MRLPVLCLGGHPRCKVAAGLLLLPTLLWIALLTVVPTECTRRTIASRLSAASGRQVRLGAVRLGWLGEVTLTGLEIGAPDGGDDPWLRVRHATIDVSVRQLLLGHVEPSEVDAEGVTLRVLRRADGSLELADLVCRPASATGEAGSAHRHDVLLRVRDAAVTVVDEPTRTRLAFGNVEARATCKGPVSTIHELSGTLNGGTFALAALLDRSGDAPVFEGQLKTADVDLDEGMNALAYLVPLLAGTTVPFDGRLSLDLYVRGEGATRERLQKSLVGHGRVVLDPIVLEGSRVLDALGRAVDIPPEGRAGSIRADLTIRNGRIATDDLTIDVARVPVVLSGWTGFDGRLDYRLRGDRLGDRLPPRAREFLAERSIKLDDVADVRVNGTVDALDVTLDGVDLGKPADATRPAPSGRQTLREIGRHIRDRIVR